jgi:hypothetical protein
MGKRLVVLALVLLGISLASAILARADSAPAKPDLSSMQFMVGTWNCVSTVSKTTFTSAVTTSLDPSHYWIITKMIERTSGSARPNSVHQMVTYSGDMNRWVSIVTDDGGNFDVETSPGWKGDTLVWTNALIGGPATTSEVERKVSDSRYTLHGSSQDKSGKVFSVDTACTRSSP